MDFQLFKNSENCDSSVFELISILIFTRKLINWMNLWIFIVRIWEYADETPHLSSTITLSLYVTIRSSFLSLPHASWCAFSFCITYFLIVWRAPWFEKYYGKGADVGGIEKVWRDNYENNRQHGDFATLRSDLIYQQDKNVFLEKWKIT